MVAFSLQHLRLQCRQVEVEQQFATHTLCLALLATSTLLLQLHDLTLAARHQQQDDDVAVMSTSATTAAHPLLSADQSLNVQHSPFVVTMVAVAAEKMTGGKT
jgi:hypothetical protein